MKAKILNGNEPITLTRVVFHYKEMRAPWEKTPPKIIAENRIRTLVYTDGEIDYDYKNMNDDEEVECHEFYFSNGQKYIPSIDTLITKKLFLKNHSYVVTILVAGETTSVGRVGGWFTLIKDIDIYLKDPKDRKALRTARKVITDIKERNSKMNYSSLYSMVMNPICGLDHFNEQELENGIHKLTKFR